MPERRKDRIPLDFTEKRFLCPNCGSQDQGSVMSVSPMRLSANPWSIVQEICCCNDCGRGIPAHLARHWNDLSVEEAKREWVERYRDRSPDDVEVPDEVEEEASPHQLSLFPSEGSS